MIDTTARWAGTPPPALRRPRRVIVAMVMVLGFLLAGGSLAQASPPAAASATMTVTAITGFAATPAGANTFVHQTTEGVFTGALIGTFEDELKGVVHPNGRVTAQGTLTCACTVEGRSGTLTFVQVSSGDFASQTLEGRAVITRGTGDLADLHGTFDIEGTVDSNGLATITFTGRMHFDG